MLSFSLLSCWCMLLALTCNGCEASKLERMARRSFLSSMISAVKACQALFLAFLTRSFAAFEIPSSSSSVARTRPFCAKDKIHSLNLAIQSKSDSHCRRSSDL